MLGSSILCWSRKHLLNTLETYPWCTLTHTQTYTPSILPGRERELFAKIHNPVTVWTPPNAIFRFPGCNFLCCNHITPFPTVGSHPLCWPVQRLGVGGDEWERRQGQGPSVDAFHRWGSRNRWSSHLLASPFLAASQEMIVAKLLFPKSYHRHVSGQLNSTWNVLE